MHWGRPQLSLNISQLQMKLYHNSPIHCLRIPLQSRLNSRNGLQKFNWIPKRLIQARVCIHITLCYVLFQSMKGQNELQITARRSGVLFKIHIPRPTYDRTDDFSHASSDLFHRRRRSTKSGQWYILRADMEKWSSSIADSQAPNSDIEVDLSRLSYSTDRRNGKLRNNSEPDSTQLRNWQ